MYESIVVSVFPGSGKNYTYTHSNALDLNCVDIDSLRPLNYVEEVQRQMGKYKFILVSYSSNVREALQRAGITFIVVMPVVGEDIKKDYITRLHNQQPNKEFQTYVDNIVKHYDEWMAPEFSKVGEPLYILHLMRGEYLSDKLYELL